MEKERGRTRDVERELKGEMERHKHSKEELGKARMGEESVGRAA